MLSEAGTCFLKEETFCMDLIVLPYFYLTQLLFGCLLLMTPMGSAVCTGPLSGIALWLTDRLEFYSFFGFLLGSTVAGASMYYYVVDEYKISNQMLSEDIYVCEISVFYRYGMLSPTLFASIAAVGNACWS